MRRIDDAIGAEIVRSNPKYADKTAKYLSELRHKLRRIASGACLWFGCPDPKGATQYCPKHNSIVLERQRKGYALNKTKKLGC